MDILPKDRYEFVEPETIIAPVKEMRRYPGLGEQKIERDPFKVDHLYCERTQEQALSSATYEKIKFDKSSGITDKTLYKYNVGSDLVGCVLKEAGFYQFQMYFSIKDKKKILARMSVYDKNMAYIGASSAGNFYDSTIDFNGCVGTITGFYNKTNNNTEYIIPELRLPLEVGTGTLLYAAFTATCLGLAE